MKHVILRLALISMLVIILSSVLVAASPGTGERGPYVDEHIWRIIIDDDAYVAALLKHEADAGGVPRVTDFPAIWGAGYQTTHEPAIGYSVLLLNNRLYPFADPAVRSAVIQLINKPGIIAALFTGFYGGVPIKLKDVCNYWLPPGQAGWIDFTVPLPTVNIPAARATLLAAGYMDTDGDGILNTGTPASPGSGPNMEPFYYLTTTPEESQVMFEMGIMITRALNAQGIPCVMDTTTFTDMFLTLMYPPLDDWQMITGIDLFWGLHEAVLYDFCESTQEPLWNLCGVRDPVLATADPTIMGWVATGKHTPAPGESRLDWWCHEMKLTLNPAWLTWCIQQVQGVLGALEPFLPLFLSLRYTAFTGAYDTQPGCIGIVNAAGDNPGCRGPFMEATCQNFLMNPWTKLLTRRETEAGTIVNPRIWLLPQFIDTLNPTLANSAYEWQVLNPVIGGMIDISPYYQEYIWDGTDGMPTQVASNYQIGFEKEHNPSSIKEYAGWENPEYGYEPDDMKTSSSGPRWWTTTEVVSTESTSVSTSPSLAVDLNGTVHVAWDDGTDYGGSGTDLDIFYKRTNGLAEEKDQYQEYCEVCEHVDHYWTSWQEFVPTVNSLSRVEVKIARTIFDPPRPTEGPITMTIESPLGNVLTSATLQWWEVPERVWCEAEWISFDVPDIALTPSQGYYIVLTTDETYWYHWSAADWDAYPPGQSNFEYPWDWTFRTFYLADTKWTTTEIVSTESTDSSEYPSLAVDSSGNIHVAWQDTTDYGGSGTDLDIFYKRYEPDSGWTMTEVVSTESTDGSWFPSLAVDVNGTVHVVWDDGTDYADSGGDKDIFYKRYVPGTGWTTTEVVSTESTGGSNHPCLAVDVNGTVHVVWDDYTDYGGSGSDVDVFYKRYVPDSGWTMTEVVSTESTDYSYAPSLAVGSNGTVHITWHDFTDYAGCGTDVDIFYKRYVPDSGWTMTEVVSTESTGNSYAPSLAVGIDGTVYVAWDDFTDYGGSGTDRDIFYKTRTDIGPNYIIYDGHYPDDFKINHWHPDIVSVGLESHQDPVTGHPEDPPDTIDIEVTFSATWVDVMDPQDPRYPGYYTYTHQEPWLDCAKWTPPVGLPQELNPSICSFTVPGPEWYWDAYAEEWVQYPDDWKWTWLHPDRFFVKITHQIHGLPNTIHIDWVPTTTYKVPVGYNFGQVVTGMYVDYTLRSNMNWTDGHNGNPPITSADIVFSLDLLRFQDNIRYRSVWDKIYKIEVIDELTVRIWYVDQFIYHFEEIGVFLNTPKHIWESYIQPVIEWEYDPFQDAYHDFWIGWDHHHSEWRGWETKRSAMADYPGEYWTDLIGIGPFVYPHAGWEPGVGIRLLANREYKGGRICRADVDINGIVDMRDVYQVLYRQGATPGRARWEQEIHNMQGPAADIAPPCQWIGGEEIYILKTHFGHKWLINGMPVLPPPCD